MTLKQARSTVQGMLANPWPNGIGRVPGETRTADAQQWHLALRFLLNVTATMSEDDAIANVADKGETQQELHHNHVVPNEPQF